VRVLNKPVPQRLSGIDPLRRAEPLCPGHAAWSVIATRAHEFSVQLRGFDAAKSGAKTGVASLIALCGALLRKSVRGGLVVVGEVTLGGTIEPSTTPSVLAEIAVEKGAKSLLLPVGPAGASCSISPTRWPRSWTSSSIRMREMRC
jgi:ATP-dependent Lon protease